MRIVGILRHLSVDRHEHRRSQHEQDERSTTSEAVGDEAEGEIAEVRADLNGNNPRERSDDAHSRATLGYGRARNAGSQKKMPQ